MAACNLTLAVLGLVLLGMGCESTDPCELRTASCLDVTLIGKRSDANDTVSYQNLVVTVTDNSGKMLATSPPMNLSGNPAPYAGLQAVVKLQMPDSFSALPDMYTPPGQEPFSQLDSITDPNQLVAMIKQLRMSDPRAVHISVTGMEQSRTPGQVGWDSNVDEDNCFSADQWINQKYYRIGMDQFAAAYAWLLPPPKKPTDCPAPAMAGM